MLVASLLVWVGTTTAQAAEEWRELALRATERLAETVEVLDESLHEAYEHHSTLEFKKAIEDMHHIEAVLMDLTAKLPAAPLADLCQVMHHLYEDLVQIRLDLIALGLEANPKVVETWNNMVNVYNGELTPYFQTCPPSWSAESSALKLKTL